MIWTAFILRLKRGVDKVLEEINRNPIPPRTEWIIRNWE